MNFAFHSDLVSSSSMFFQQSPECIWLVNRYLSARLSREAFSLIREKRDNELDSGFVLCFVADVGQWSDHLSALLQDEPKEWSSADLQER